MRRGRTGLTAAVSDLPAGPSIDDLLAVDATSPLGATDLAHLVGLLGKAGRDEEAGAFAARLLRLRPAHRRALRALARCPQPGSDAAAGWRTLADADPKDPEPWLQLARLAAREKAAVALLQACDELLARAPDHPEGLARRTAALISLGRADDLAETWTRLQAVDADRAADVLARAMAADDADAAAVLLGAAAAAGALDGRGDAARENLRRQYQARASAAAAEADAAAEVAALWRLGRLDSNDRETASALAAAVVRLRAEVDGAGTEPPPRLAPAARILARVDPGARQAHILLGRIAARALAWREAAEAFSAALAVDDADGPLWCELAIVSARRGRMDDALTALRRGQSVGGGAPSARFTEAETLLRGLADAGQRAAFDRADASAASSLLQAMITLGADPARLEDRIARLTKLTARLMTEAAEARAPETVDLARLFLAQVPNDERARLVLGRALLRERYDAEAVDVWTRIAADRPADPEPSLQIARLGKRLGRPDIGLPAAEKLMTIAPGHPEGRILLEHFQATG
ncbi:MAG: hypothetical protein ABI056_04490 [Caulobacteraceae bacterium]